MIEWWTMLRGLWDKIHKNKKVMCTATATATRFYFFIYEKMVEQQ